MTKNTVDETTGTANGNSRPTENAAQDDIQGSKSYGSERPVCIGILVQGEKWEVTFTRMRYEGWWDVVTGLGVGGTSEFVDFCKLLKCLESILDDRERAFSGFYMALGQTLAA